MEDQITIPEQEAAPATSANVEVVVFGLRLQNANLAVSVLVVLFVIGYALFCKADKLNKARK